MPRNRRTNHAIDEKDYALLELMQEDCRRSDVEISKALKEKGIILGPAACKNRLNRLFEEEYIIANCSILNPSKFDAGQLCFMLVAMRTQDRDSVRDFLELAEQDKAVLEIHEMTGICDYLMKIRVRNMAEATRLSQKLASKVATIHTHAAGESPKEVTAIPLPRREEF